MGLCPACHIERGAVENYNAESQLHQEVHGSGLEIPALRYLERLSLRGLCAVSCRLNTFLCFSTLSL